MTSFPITPQTPASSSSEPSPITAPGLRMKPRPTPGPIPSATDQQTSTPPPPHVDPIDAAGSIHSGDSGPAKTVGASAFRDIARGLITTITLGINQRLAPTKSPDIRAAQVWRATEAEAAQIGDPLVSMAARRGMTAGGDSDTADLVMMALGIGGYLLKNLSTMIYLGLAARRRTRAAGADLAPPEAEPVSN